MKKILFGITLILFSIAFCLLGETSHTMWLRNELAEVIYIILPLVGLGISISGFLEKEKSRDE